MTMSGWSQDPNTYKRSCERQDLLTELEKQADQSDMNIDHLLSLYRKMFPGEAVWALVQDINRQALVWYNVLETLKRSPEPPKTLKKNYETHLQLLPVGSLSNPNWPFDIDRAFDKLKNYGKGLVKIARYHAMELLIELNVEAGHTATVQVQLGWPPSLNIGMERSR